LAGLASGSLRRPFPFPGTTGDRKLPCQGLLACVGEGGTGLRKNQAKMGASVTFVMVSVGTCYASARNGSRRRAPSCVGAGFKPAPTPYRAREDSPAVGKQYLTGYISSVTARIWKNFSRLYLRAANVSEEKALAAAEHQEHRRSISGARLLTMKADHRSCRRFSREPFT